MLCKSSRAGIPRAKGNIFEKSITNFDKEKDMASTKTMKKASTFVQTKHIFCRIFVSASRVISFFFGNQMTFFVEIVGIYG